MTVSQPPHAELRKLLEDDQQRRIQAVRMAIQTTLSEHNCELQAHPQIIDGRIVAVIMISPK